jgi:hypothetical protein
VAFRPSGLPFGVEAGAGGIEEGPLQLGDVVLALSGEQFLGPGEPCAPVQRAGVAAELLPGLQLRGCPAVPGNIMSGMNAITVSMDVQIGAAQVTPHFLYGFGDTAPPPPPRCSARSGSMSPTPTPTPRPAPRASSTRTAWNWIMRCTLPGCITSCRVLDS